MTTCGTYSLVHIKQPQITDNNSTLWERDMCVCFFLCTLSSTIYLSFQSFFSVALCFCFRSFVFGVLKSELRFCFERFCFLRARVNTRFSIIRLPSWRCWIHDGRPTSVKSHLLRLNLEKRGEEIPCSNRFSDAHTLADSFRFYLCLLCCVSQIHSIVLVVFSVAVVYISLPSRCVFFSASFVSIYLRFHVWFALGVKIIVNFLLPLLACSSVGCERFSNRFALCVHSLNKWLLALWALGTWR